MDKWEYKALLEESADNGVFPSEGEDGCAYRKDYTKSCKTRCAIGLLIPDVLYRKYMEGKDAKGLIEEHPELEEYIKIDGLSNKDMLMIQETHDSLVDGWSIDTFKEELNSLDCFKDDDEV